jgi:hypothetical protein
MPASKLLKALGLLTALAIAAAALLYAPAGPPPDPYIVTVKLVAGAAVVIGSIYLARAIGATLLSGGGRGAFKALYWAAFASAGAGIAEAASGLAAVNLPAAAGMASLAFACAGLMLLRFSGGH